MNRQCSKPSTSDAVYKGSWIGYSGCNKAVKKSMQHLDRHNVECPSGYFLNSWRLGKYSCSGGDMRIRVRCVKWVKNSGRRAEEGRLLPEQTPAPSSGESKAVAARLNNMMQPRDNGKSKPRDAGFHFEDSLDVEDRVSRDDDDRESEPLDVEDRVSREEDDRESTSESLEEEDRVSREDEDRVSRDDEDREDPEDQSAELAAEAENKRLADEAMRYALEAAKRAEERGEEEYTLVQRYKIVVSHEPEDKE